MEAKALNVLIVEDEETMADAVAYTLRKEGFDVVIAKDGSEGLDRFRQEDHDLIILDIMLPKINGFDLCRTIRGTSDTPIIMLTAKDEEIDRVVGLELGADDYIIKPFSMREFVARIKALLRRTHVSRDTEQPEIIRVGDLVIDCDRRLVLLHGDTVHLPLKEFQILRALIRNKDKVLTREGITRKAWPEDAYCDTRTLDVHIRWLREKIEDDPSMPKRIVTVRGIGYMFVGKSDDQTD